MGPLELGSALAVGAAGNALYNGPSLIGQDNKAYLTTEELLTEIRDMFTNWRRYEAKKIQEPTWEAIQLQKLNQWRLDYKGFAYV